MQWLQKMSLKKLTNQQLLEYKNLLEQCPQNQRSPIIRRHGVDTKFLYHLVRLSLEAEEILSTGDLHLDQNGPFFRAIREGEWSLDRTEKWFVEKELALEKLYNSSSLPYGPDEERIKRLLLQCLEQYYGKLAVIPPSEERAALEEIEKIINRVRR